AALGHRPRARHRAGRRSGRLHSVAGRCRSRVAARRTVMTRADLFNPATLPAPPGYSHVAVVPPGSRLVWTAGQVAVGPDGTPLPAGDWEAQTRQAMRNVELALAAGGASWHDVFKLTIFVADTPPLETLRAVRDEFVDVSRPP